MCASPSLMGLAVAEVCNLRNNLTAYDAVYVALAEAPTLRRSRATVILPQRLAIVRGIDVKAS